MDPEENHFMSVLINFNIELDRRGINQDRILQNDQHGVFLTFEGITVNYNLPSFDNNREDYLQEQRERHKNYLKVLEEQRLEREGELERFRKGHYTVIPSLQPSSEELADAIQHISLDLAFDKVYKEGALIGKYFFEVRLGERKRAPLIESMLEKLITYATSISTIAGALEIVDAQRLEHLKERQLEWYGQG